MARFRVRIYAVMTALVDAGPNSVRFGRWRELRRRLMSQPLPTLGSAATGAAGAPLPVQAESSLIESVEPVRATALLVTGSLGTGGIETVIGMLARDLPQHGVGARVMCADGGQTAAALRAESIRVDEARDTQTASGFLVDLPPGTVAQLHNAPEHLIEACRLAHVPIMPVLHTTDINLSSAQWERGGRLTNEAVVSVAVSETVRGYHLRHMPQRAKSPIVVIPNGVDSHPISAGETSHARAALARAIRTPLADDEVVFLCLARYDLQKNVPALVSAFMAAASKRTDMHLVIAGPVSDWLEYRYADALRASHPAGSRVHLLGASDPRRLLAAADVFVLNSFFEGWAVAASEAVMAGLPVVVSETGGATELVGSDGARGYLVGNPAGSAETMSRKQIQHARRRTESQTNRDGLIEAMLDAHDRIISWRTERRELAAQAATWLSRQEMIAAHANAISDVVTRETA